MTIGTAEWASEIKTVTVWLMIDTCDFLVVCPTLWLLPVVFYFSTPVQPWIVLYCAMVPCNSSRDFGDSKDSTFAQLLAEKNARATTSEPTLDGDSCYPVIAIEWTTCSPLSTTRISDQNDARHDVHVTTAAVAQQQVLRQTVQQ